MNTIETMSRFLPSGVLSRNLTRYRDTHLRRTNRGEIELVYKDRTLMVLHPTGISGPWVSVHMDENPSRAVLVRVNRLLGGPLELIPHDSDGKVEWFYEGDYSGVCNPGDCLNDEDNVFGAGEGPSRPFVNPPSRRRGPLPRFL